MMKNLIIYCLFIIAGLIIINSLFGQAESEPVKLDSPYNSISNHLTNLTRNNYFPDIAVKSLNSVKVSAETAVDLSIKLKRIYDGRGLWIDMDKIPKSHNYIDSVTGKNKYIVFPELPELYLEKYGDKWLYSSESLAMIEPLYNATYPIDSFTFIESIPQYWKNSFFSVQLWQIAGFFLIIVVCFLLYFVIRWLSGFLLLRISSKLFTNEPYQKYIIPVSKPVSFLIISSIYTQLLYLLGLPNNISYFISMIIRIIQPILITIIIYRASEFVTDIFGRIAAKSNSTVDDHLVPFVRKGLKILIVILGSLYLLNNVGIDITPLLAGVSIGGLALALAAQDTVKNLFGSVTIFTDQPFVVGDLIKFDSTEGNVEEVGIRSTRLRTLYNSQISIPNGKLADSTIDNLGRREMRRFSTKLSVTYDTPPVLIDNFITGLRIIIQNHPMTTKDNYQVYLNDLAESAILIIFHTFIDVKDWGAELKAKHELISEIIKLADVLGIRFAFPTRTLHIEDFPEKLSKTPVHNINFEDQKVFLNNYKPFSDLKKTDTNLEEF